MKIAIRKIDILSGTDPTLDKTVLSHLMALKKMGSEESGSVRIVNDGDVHADRFWAYALAWRAYQLGGALYEYQGSSGNAQQGRNGRPVDPSEQRDGRGTRMPARAKSKAHSRSWKKPASFITSPTPTETASRSPRKPTIPSSSSSSST